jgi:hypothetical protein
MVKSHERMLLDWDPSDRLSYTLLFQTLLNTPLGSVINSSFEDAHLQQQLL